MKKVLRIFLITSIIFLQIQAMDIYDDEYEDVTRKGYKYVEEFNAYYRYEHREYSFYLANLFCTEDGAKLFFPQSEKEAMFIYEEYEKFYTFGIWIGAGVRPHDNFTKLHDVEGGNAEYLQTLIQLVGKYTSGIVMRSPTEYVFQFWETKFRFICKKLVEPQGLNVEQGILLLDNGYFYKKEFNSFYKYQRNSIEYGKELIWCNMDGGTTFLPESREEALVPWSMNIDKREKVYVGISKVFYSNFKTVEGKNFSGSYRRAYEPFYFLGLDYLAIDESGEYYSTSSTGSNWYICQIKSPVYRFNGMNCHVQKTYDDQYKFICKRADKTYGYFHLFEFSIWSKWFN